MVCFTLRPGPPSEDSEPGVLNGTQQNTTSLDIFNVTPPVETLNEAGITLDKKILSNLILLNLLNITEEEKNGTRDLSMNETKKYFMTPNANNEIKLNGGAEVVTEAFDLMNSAPEIPDENDNEELKSKKFVAIDQFRLLFNEF